MGYFGDIYNIDENIELTEKMISIIKRAFPYKSDKELYRMPFESLRGLYGRATQVIEMEEAYSMMNKENEYQNGWDAYREEEEYWDRNGHH